MHSNDPYLDDEIDLLELIRVVWEEKKLIVLITAIVAISSVLYSLSLTNYYQSESLITIKNDSQSQGLLSQYSGTAALLGINLPTGGDNKALQVIETIQSRKFVKHLLTFENILPSMMAAKTYDRSSKELLFDPRIYDSEAKTWKRKPNKNGILMPSYLEAHRVYRQKLMSISHDNKTGFITIRIKHISPIFAKEFLELIIREANTLLRNRDLELSSQALKYLEFELSQTSLVEIRESINTLIESQLEIQMMAKINEDYVLVEIEPPFIPEEKSEPNRSTIVVLATVLGGLLSVIIILVRYYFFDKETTSTQLVD